MQTFARLVICGYGQREIYLNLTAALQH